MVRMKKTNEAIAADVRASLERKLGAPWGPTDTLPMCPVCHTPAMPGRNGGFLCMTRTGKLREPHAARVNAWARELHTQTLN